MKEKNRQKNVYENLKANDFVQTNFANVMLQNSKTFIWID